LIFNEEESRILRVCILLAEDDKCELSTRLEEASEQFYKAEKTGSLARENLQHAQNDSAQLRNSLRAKEREIVTLKVSNLMQLSFKKV